MELKEVFKGIFRSILIGLIILVIVWLPLFILGETGVIGDDMASIFFFSWFGFPLVLIILSLITSIYYFIKKRSAFALGIIILPILLEVITIIFWVALSAGGEL